LSEEEQEERRPDGTQQTESEPVIEKDCLSLFTTAPICHRKQLPLYANSEIIPSYCKLMEVSQRVRLGILVVGSNPSTIESPE
jgi:hypothetical protein